ncbi:hypothetical protein PYW08_009645 [Mythimna loreyi]|uniref:Uncharacterized protein n=1 Tax=Mythimna loreyi TaxID=667449 RepID=A0ACC2Q6M8_9NEOP|nr:hypothetical protein PYW08_009645 [Mythimna loreyi]
MSTLVLLALLLCLVIAAWFYMKPHPHSPPIFPGALPFIGHSLLLLGDRKHLWDIFRRIQLYALEKGGVCETWVGPYSIYVISDPEDSLKVSNICLDKAYFYEFPKDLVNNGLVTAKASVWKHHRKLLNPAFNQQVINTYVNEMNVQAKTLVSQLAPKAGKEPIDVQNYFISYILSIVTRTSLKVSSEHQVLLDTTYAKTMHDLVVLYCDRGQKIWLHLSSIYKWSAMKRKEDELTKKMRDITNSIVQKRKSELNANDVSDKDSEPISSSGKFKPILDQMLQLNKEQDVFTDDDIVEHMQTLVVAANDTSSAALTLIMLIIGTYPNVQERIFDELQEVFQHDDTDITKENLQKLVYLEAVIKESMRLYPVVPIVARKVDVEVKLKNYTMRAGSSCMIGLYSLLRHPLWGPDAEEFRPDRWLDPASLPSHPSLYAAFSVGKRNCIGKLFSMIVMKMALAHICRRYHITGDINNIECEFDVILKPVKGHHIYLTPRK